VLKVGRPGFDFLGESSQKTLKVGIYSIGVGIRGQSGAVIPWIFIDGADKLEGDLLVLFFSLVFPVSSPLEIFLPTPLIHSFST